MAAQHLTFVGRLRITEVHDAGIKRPLVGAEMQKALRFGGMKPSVLTCNRITDIGLDTLVALMAGGIGSPSVGSNVYTDASIHVPAPRAGAPVGSMKLTAYPSGGIVVPANGDTALQGTVIFTRTVDGVPPLLVTYPAVGQVQFSSLVPQPDYDGTTFTEEGLFSVDDQLIARTTFTQLKTTAYALQVDHLFAVSRI